MMCVDIIPMGIVQNLLGVPFIVVHVGVLRHCVVADLRDFFIFECPIITRGDQEKNSQQCHFLKALLTERIVCVV